MSSRIRSRSLCSRLSRQGFPCSWCGLGAVLLFVMAYPPVAETSSKEIPVLFSTTSQEHTPFTFLQESGQNQPGATYTYDSNGNTVSKTDATGTTNYTWDYENRLASVTLPGSGGTVTFKYDPFGRRIYKSSSSGTSIYAYDGDNPIEETNASGTAVARYTQTENIDEPLAMLRSSTTSYYQADGLRSVTSLSNAAGALAQTYTFDSFGQPT